MRKYWDVLGLVAVSTINSNTFLSLFGSIPYYQNITKIIQHHYINGSKPCTVHTVTILAYLVNLINNSERRTGKLLQGHEIQNSRNTFLSTTLMVLCENMKTVLSSEFHFNLYSILFIVFLTLDKEDNIIIWFNIIVWDSQKRAANPSTVFFDKRVLS